MPRAIETLRAWWRAALYGAVVLGAAATFLPFVPTDAWEIRVLDFPRLQVTVVLVLALGGLLALRRTRVSVAMAAAASAAILASAILLAPFLLPIGSDHQPVLDAFCVPAHPAATHSNSGRIS